MHVKSSSAKASRDPEVTFVCPLSQMRVGVACRIKQLKASPEIARRLREMGLCEDQHVKLLSQRSNVICQVCNLRLGISPKLAAAIWVEPLTTKEKAA